MDDGSTMADVQIGTCAVDTRFKASPKLSPDSSVFECLFWHDSAHISMSIFVTSFVGLILGDDTIAM